MMSQYRALLPNIALANVAPVLFYWVIRPHVASDAEALAIVTVFPLLDIALTALRSHRLGLFGVIGLAGIGIGLIGSALSHGDPTALKLKGMIPTSVIGFAFLASLLMSRPIPFHLHRAIETAGDPDKVAAFNVRWHHPRVAHAYRVVTAVWGLGLLAQAAIGCILALTLPTQKFLICSEVVSWSFNLGLVFFTGIYSNRVTKTLVFNLDVAVKTTEGLRIAEASSVAPGIGHTNLAPLFARLVPEVLGYLVRVDALPGIMVAWYDEPSNDGRVVLHVGFDIGDQSVPNADGISVVDLPGLRVAAMIHRGTMENVGPVHEALIRWIEDSGHQLAGMRRLLFHEWSMDEPQRRVTELQMPLVA